jgi:small subunit ribosomal protein S14
MAKTSQVQRDKRRMKLAQRYAAKRGELRRILQDQNASIDEKLAAQEAFAKLPRNSCPTRITRRCELTGRARAVYRKYGISRIKMRELAHKGQLPGVRKSSW